MDIKIVLEDAARPPQRKTRGAAGYDLFSLRDYILTPNEVTLINTGVKIELPNRNMCGIIKGRSGLMVKHKILIIDGIIDSDYRGSLMVMAFNKDNKPYKVQKHDSIAQIVFNEVLTPNLIPVTNITETERGSGGFGSTGY